MFGKKKETYIDNMLIVTTEEIPGRKFEVIGLVTADVSGGSGETNFSKVAQRLIAEARQVNANAIVGFRAQITITVQRIAGGPMSQSAYGTAVKFID
jgi:uncharacterized protein YbjQ (UPF0145 family)